MNAHAGLIILRAASLGRDAQNERDGAGLRSSIAAATPSQQQRRVAAATPSQQEQQLRRSSNSVAAALQPSSSTQNSKGRLSIILHVRSWQHLEEGRAAQQLRRSSSCAAPSQQQQHQQATEWSRDDERPVAFENYGARGMA